MKIKLALEWFINPDHLPFIVGLDKGLYKKNLRLLDNEPLIASSIRHINII